MGDLETIIFDFDGTLGDTLHIVRDISIRLCKKHFDFELKEEDIEHFRGIGAKEMLYHVFNNSRPGDKNGSDYGYVKRFVGKMNSQYNLWWHFPEIMKEGLQMFYDQRHLIKPYNGIVKAVKDLSQEGYKILILSSNKKETIYKILESNDWDIKYNGIYHSNRLFGKHYEMKKIMAERGWRHIGPHTHFQEGLFRGLNLFLKNGIWTYDAGKVLYVGDEARDVHACNNLGVKMIGVTWGLNNEKALLNAGLPHDCIVNQPLELPEKIRYIQNL